MYVVKKHEWYKLSTKEKIESVLDLIENKGYTADDLVDYFDVKTKRVITDFMNSKGYSKQGGRYILKDSTKLAGSAAIVKKNTNTTIAANFNEELLNNMVNIAKQYDRIQELLIWFDNKDNMSTPEINNNIVELVNTALPIPKVEGEIKRTTIRINETILNDFNELWRTEYSEYKQHDLLGIALQMFIDKYKKN